MRGHIAFRGQHDHCYVIHRLKDSVQVMCGYAVMGVEGVEKRAQHTALRNSSVKHQGQGEMRDNRSSLYLWDEILSP